MLRFFILSILFAILTLLQTTLLVHIPIFGIVPNFVFIIVIIFAFLEMSHEVTSFWYAVVGGIFLDLFSANFFGLWTLALLISVFLVKFVVKSYVRPPILQG